MINHMKLCRSDIKNLEQRVQDLLVDTFSMHANLERITHNLNGLRTSLEIALNITDTANNSYTNNLKNKHHSLRVDSIDTLASETENEIQLLTINDNISIENIDNKE